MKLLGSNFNLKVNPIENDDENIKSIRILQNNDTDSCNGTCTN